MQRMFKLQTSDIIVAYCSSLLFLRFSVNIVQQLNGRFDTSSVNITHLHDPTGLVQRRHLQISFAKSEELARKLKLSKSQRSLAYGI